MYSKIVDDNFIASAINELDAPTININSVYLWAMRQYELLVDTFKFILKTNDIRVIMDNPIINNEQFIYNTKPFNTEDDNNCFTSLLALTDLTFEYVPIYGNSSSYDFNDNSVKKYYVDISKGNMIFFNYKLIHRFINNRGNIMYAYFLNYCKANNCDQSDNDRINLYLSDPSTIVNLSTIGYNILWGKNTQPNIYQTINTANNLSNENDTLNNTVNNSSNENNTVIYPKIKHPDAIFDMLKIGDKIVLIQEYAGCHAFGVIVSFTKSENQRIRLVNSNIEKTNSMYGDTIKYNPTFENIDGTIYTSRYNKTKFKSYTISISRNIYYFYKKYDPTEKYEKVTYM